MTGNRQRKHRSQRTGRWVGAQVVWGWKAFGIEAVPQAVARCGDRAGSERRKARPAEAGSSPTLCCATFRPAELSTACATWDSFSYGQLLHKRRGGRRLVSPGYASCNGRKRRRSGRKCLPFAHPVNASNTRITCFYCFASVTCFCRCLRAGRRVMGFAEVGRIPPSPAPGGRGRRPGPGP